MKKDNEKHENPESNVAGPGAENQNENELSSGQRHKTRSGTRKDRGALHVTRHGALSSYPLQALARRGVNVRQLRRVELELRRDLKPTGIVAELIFDRLWSSYLRCILIARSEADAFLPLDQEPNASGALPHLREGDVPVLVWHERREIIEQFSDNLMRHLAIVQKYDSHFSRELFRCVGVLIAMRDDGDVALAKQLTKSFGQNKNENVDA